MAPAIAGQWRRSRVRGAAAAIVLVAAALQPAGRVAFTLGPAAESRRLAWAGRGQVAERARREVLAQQGLLAALLVGLQQPSPAVAQEAPPQKRSKWSGNWDDPDAPGCKRQIIVNFDGKKAAIRGADSLGNPNTSLIDPPKFGNKNACNQGDKTEKWSAYAMLDSADADEIKIDFSKAGGPADVVAKWDNGAIAFPDGSRWTKISRR